MIGDDSDAAFAHLHDLLDAAHALDARGVDTLVLLLKEAIRGAKLRLGVDPLGGAGVAYWPRIAERYGLNLTAEECGRQEQR